MMFILLYIKFLATHIHSAVLDSLRECTFYVMFGVILKRRYGVPCIATRVGWSGKSRQKFDGGGMA